MYLFFTSIKTTYEKFEIHFSLDESLDVANVAGGTLNNGQNGLKSEASIERNPSFWIHDSDDEDFVIGTLNTKPNEIESDTISNQSTFDAYTFNNG